MRKVVVFTRNGCPACGPTKDMLTRLGVEFTEINVQAEGNEHWQAVLAFEKKVMGMPYIEVYEDDVLVDTWTGAKPDKMRALVAA